MTVRVLAAHDLKPVPWKNGGGVTREIAAWPPGSGMDDFQWRVSTAEVASDGPFSRFGGVDRVLVILDGAGFDLAVEGAEVHRLTPKSDPLAFAADVPTSATLIAGLVSDLNIMVRRGAWTARVERRAIAAPAPFTCATDACLIMLRGPLSLGGIVALETGDVVRMERGDVITLVPTSGASQVLVIALSPV